MLAGVDDDRELLGRWRGGDAAAGSTLVRRHTAGLLRMFHGRVAAPVDAVQEVLLGCVRSRDRVPDGLPFRVYLFGVARRVLLHELRRTARRRSPEELDAEEVAGGQQRPSEMIAEAQARRRLSRALHGLPHELQVVVMLHYWEGFRMHEVAAACEIPEGTVKSRLSRARALLREALAREVSDPAELQATLAGLETWARALQEDG
jgi:RNA polymerase sigma factor (sigma-70 family)